MSVQKRKTRRSSKNGLIAYRLLLWSMALFRKISTTLMRPYLLCDLLQLHVLLPALTLLTGLILYSQGIANGLQLLRQSMLWAGSFLRPLFSKPECMRRRGMIMGFVHANGAFLQVQMDGLQTILVFNSSKSYLFHLRIGSRRGNIACWFLMAIVAILEY